jgi:exodeoxyribonuclease III
LIRQQHGSLETWLKKHQVDILCLQEVKATVEKLTMTPQAFGIQRGGTAAAVSGRSDSDAAPSLAEYESYWACCTSREAKGFNGVATFARKGLTLGANSTPLGSALFDDEGRVLATDHGYFVLFNVYAPNTGSSHRDRYHFKAEFYEKLQTAMHHVRRQGRSVICLGDLNVSARAEDLAPSFRVVHIERALNWKAPPERIRRDFDDSRAQLMMLTDIMKEFCFAWPHVVAMLRSKRITPVQIKCAKSMVTKFRVIADVPISQETGSLLGRQSAASKTRRVVLGTPFDKEEYAQWSYCLADERLAIPTSSHFAHLPSPETNVDSPNVFATRISEGAAPGSMNSIDPALTGRGVTLSLGELTECVTKSTNVSWTPSQVLLFSRINSFDAETLENKTSQLPVLSSRSPDIFAKWLTDLSIVDGMVKLPFSKCFITMHLTKFIIDYWSFLFHS